MPDVLSSTSQVALTAFAPIAGLPPLVDRKDGVKFLCSQGYKITERYFGKLCCPSIGQGPRVDRWFNGRALYLPEDLLAWAEARCRPGDSPRERCPPPVPGSKAYG